ncbi:hypothetical protein LTR08_003325 [Meristemomyces frigidus]|nr:hypothetical protein LTR08_003325 [Meristemomyces frigidus]
MPTPPTPPTREKRAGGSSPESAFCASVPRKAAKAAKAAKRQRDGAADPEIENGLPGPLKMLSSKTSKQGVRPALGELQQPHSDPIQSSTLGSATITKVASPFESWPDDVVELARLDSPFVHDAHESEYLNPSLEAMSMTEVFILRGDVQVKRLLQRLEDQRKAHEDQRKAHEDERKAQTQHELQFKQDIVLEFLKKDEVLEKTGAAVKRWQRETQKATEDLGREKRSRSESTIRQAEEMRKQIEKTAHAECDAKMWKNASEHATTMHRIQEEDLEELKVILNEEIAQHRDSKKRSQLPPAYGSLDDEAQLPPYEFHTKDSGALEVATFKRTVRDKFMRDIAGAQNRLDATMAATAGGDLTEDRNAARAAMLKTFVVALAAASTDTDDVLKRSHIICAFVVGRASADGDRPIYIRGIYARQDYIADRVAKLVLDLTYRFIAAVEVRPDMITLNLEERAYIASSWSAVDSALLEAVRKAFNGRSSGSGSLSSSCRAKVLLELQLYLTQVTMLQSKLVGMRMTDTPLYQRDGHGPYFERTRAWLVQLVEKERELLAQMKDAAVMAVVPVCDGKVEDHGASVVSSCPSRHEPELDTDAEAWDGEWGVNLNG